MSSFSELTLEQSSKAFDGYQYVYSHESFTLDCPKKFGLYIPSIADRECLPLLIFLSDSNWTEQTFILKSGVQRLASKYGFLVANPETTFGDQMFSYINEEFYELLISYFNVDIQRIGILGHGLGGHDALISFFKCPAQYRSVSALAPVSNALDPPDEDPCALVKSYSGPMPYAPVLIDHNSNDEQSSSQTFLAACCTASFPLQLRDQLGYEQAPYFLATFLEDHFKYHQNEFEHAD